MFVRFIKDVDGRQHEFIHECRNVKVYPDTENQNSLIFDIIDVAYQAAYIIEKKPGNEVYLMNSRGQTIDSYRWGDSTPKVDQLR